MSAGYGPYSLVTPMPYFSPSLIGFDTALDVSMDDARSPLSVAPEDTKTKQEETVYVPSNAVASTSSSHPMPGTDFTKRKNWSQNIIEELKDFLHVLSPTGKVMYASPSSVQLLGYQPEELVGLPITHFLHTDDIDIFIRDFNLCLHTRNPLHLFYRFRKKDNTMMVLECRGHAWFGEQGTAVLPKCFFGVAAEYPTKLGSMLDSFLEVKVENEFLTRRLRQLQKKRQIGRHLQHRHPSITTEQILPPASTSADSVVTASEGSDQFGIPRRSTLPITSNPHQSSWPKHRLSMPTLSTHLEGLDDQTIDLLKSPGMKPELLAGYGLSDNTSLTSVVDSGEGSNSSHGEVAGESDMDDGAPVRRESTSKHKAEPSTDEHRLLAHKPPRKKKKGHVKQDHDFVCTDCGTTDSPEWRKGPHGPKTLCNACGLRWAKKNKKESEAAPETQWGWRHSLDMLATSV